MTTLKVGEYYYIGDYKDKKDCIVVKIMELSKKQEILEYVMVKIIRPSCHPIYSNWSSYAKYGIPIPISPSEFIISKKLTKLEILAVEL